MREVTRTGAIGSNRSMSSYGRGDEAGAQRRGAGEDDVRGRRGDSGAGASIRDVAAGAAHDLANLLQKMGFGIEQLSGERLSPVGEESIRAFRAELTYLRMLARALRAAAAEGSPSAGVRGTRLTSALLTDAVAERLARAGRHGGTVGAGQADARTFLAGWWPGMSQLLHAVHGKDVVVRADLSWKLPPLGISADHLTQMVLNLVGNSVHAIQERMLATADGAMLWPAVTISGRLSADERTVNLTVSDNGAGMTEEALARAGEPYFTTRKSAGGTGLGLAMVRRLAEAAGGKMRVRSQKGFGTSVTLELPVRFGDVLVAVSASGRLNEFEPGMES